MDAVFLINKFIFYLISVSIAVIGAIMSSELKYSVNLLQVEKLSVASVGDHVTSCLPATLEQTAPTPPTLMTSLPPRLHPA